MIGRRCIRSFSKDLYIGKPDKQSNVRPLLFTHSDDDTKLQKRLKDLQYKTQLWHHKFWSEHNQKYSQGREEYIQKHFSDKKIDAENMALFHRQFLLENYGLLKKYDKEWKKLNRTIIFLMAASTLQRIYLKMFRPFRKQTTL